MSDTYTLELRAADETAALGSILARAMTNSPFSLLMTGDLGCGKTTLTRALVEALPGGESAETSSPSFTLCNVYPTTPPIVHCDLYRQGAGPLLPDGPGAPDPAGAVRRERHRDIPNPRARRP